MPEKEWFASWFDSKYYHTLYNNRDYSEAQRFINNLIDNLSISAGKRVLDLACGKGRHSAQLAQNELLVTGLDLSVQSIEHAASLGLKNTEFYTHDMRKPFRTNYYDYVMNLFTSFGYFETINENIQTLKSVYKGLKKEGILIIDFFNINHVMQNLVAEETIERGQLKFHITRALDNGKIIKTITFKDEKNQPHSYQEKVSAFGLHDFDTYLRQCGFFIQKTYGDYSLNDFDVENSPRLILVAQKIEQ